MDYKTLFAKHGIQLIRYELETSPFLPRNPTPEIAQRLAVLGRTAEDRCKKVLENCETTITPCFHPGRVFVSREVMLYLGKLKVWVFLNLYVRGNLSDSWMDHSEGPPYVEHALGGELRLDIHTNTPETRTVVRFRHERKYLRGKRRWERELCDSTASESIQSERKEDDPIPF